MKKCLSILFIIVAYSGFSQTKWYSEKYKYSIEIPNGFSISEGIGNNVDFKANNGKNSIVVVIKEIPSDYLDYTIWDIIGDLETYGLEWETGAREYMNSPKFLEYGKTSINSVQTFWYDYTTENPKLYSKTYQTKKENILYTITLTCEFDKYNFYSPIWYRFKENITL